MIDPDDPILGSETVARRAAESRARDRERERAAAADARERRERSARVEEERRTEERHARDRAQVAKAAATISRVIEDAMYQVAEEKRQAAAQEQRRREALVKGQEARRTILSVLDQWNLIKGKDLAADAAANAELLDAMHHRLHYMKHDLCEHCDEDVGNIPEFSRELPSRCSSRLRGEIEVSYEALARLLFSKAEARFLKEAEALLAKPPAEDTLDDTGERMRLSVGRYYGGPRSSHKLFDARRAGLFTKSDAIEKRLRATVSEERSNLYHLVRRIEQRGIDTVAPENIQKHIVSGLAGNVPSVFHCAMFAAWGETEYPEERSEESIKDHCHFVVRNTSLTTSKWRTRFWLAFAAGAAVLLNQHFNQGHSLGWITFGAFAAIAFLGYPLRSLETKLVDSSKPNGLARVQAALPEKNEQAIRASLIANEAHSDRIFEWGKAGSGRRDLIFLEYLAGFPCLANELRGIKDSFDKFREEAMVVDEEKLASYVADEKSLVARVSDINTAVDYFAAKHQGLSFPPLSFSPKEERVAATPLRTTYIDLPTEVINTESEGSSKIASWVIGALGVSPWLWMWIRYASV
jgi:hypothetical protein